MKRYIFVVLVLVLLTQPVSAKEGVGDILSRAESAYNSGDYGTAIALYSSLVDSGVQDGTLFFNLGHAYYQVGDLGHAMLYYRRAQDYFPRDGNLSLGLARVRSRRIDIQGDETPFTDSIAALTLDSLTIRELSWLVLLIWSGWFGTLTFYLRRIERQESLRIGLIIGGGLLLIGCVLLASRLYVGTYRPAAVVVRAASPVMSGPGEDYLEHYRIHAATEIRILEWRGDWVRFTLPDGQQGWVLRSAIELV
jgi:hypothetical protein